METLFVQIESEGDRTGKVKAVFTGPQEGLMLQETPADDPSIAEYREWIQPK